jgi:PAS domain S-box-containing protein
MSTRVFEQPGLVLIVDEDQESLQRISRHLASQNHAILTADAVNALEHAKKHKPDLVLLGMAQSSQAGLELCRQIKNDPDLEHTIVMLMTTATDSEAHRQVIECGASDFLKKPVSDHMLDMRVRFALKYHRAVLQMRKSYRDLEQRVETRTAELARINAELKSEIGERERAKESLRESEARYRAIFHATFDGLIIHNDGAVLDFNPGAAQMFGYRRDELLKMQFLDIAMPESRDLIRAKIEAGDERPYEAMGLRKDGSAFAIELVGKFHLWNGRRVRVTALRDICDRKALELQLRSAQKMEAVGRLAGGVAHDFNNLLMIITGYTDLILEQMPEGDRMREDARMIQGAADRAARLTQQLLAFSRRQVMQPRLVDLSKIVSDMEKMLRRIIGEDIDLSTKMYGAPVRGKKRRIMGETTDLKSLDAHCGVVRADPGQIEQVILNLVVNARDAMPDGGSLTIETANVELDDAYVKLHIGAKVGRYVMMSISDTGCGMSEQTKAQLFEPFFTTKEQGKGTGLGLSTAYGIVKQSNGYIAVYSEEGVGTTFKIYFPRVEEGEIEPALAETPVTVRRGSETILLVEDEFGVRELVRELLTQAGYEVVDAPNGVEALSIFESTHQKIDLMITDAVMPQMSGRELVDRAKRVRPDLKVLYMSGYTDKAIVHDGVLEEGTAFLGKPFKADTLLLKVRELLDNRVATTTSDVY